MSTAAAPQETPAVPEAPAGGTPAPESAPALAPAAATEGGTPEATQAAEAKPWWQEVGGGKYPDEAAAIKGFGEVYGMANKSAKALKEAEERWGTIAPMFGAPVGEDGKPVPYDIKLPEGAELDASVKGIWESFLREKNLSPAVAQEAFEKVILPLEYQRELGQREFERDGIITGLGNGDEAVATALADHAFKQIAQTLVQKGYGEEAMEDLRECAGFRAGMMTMARLHTPAQTIKMGSSTGGGSGLDAAGVQELLKKPGAMSDPVTGPQITAYYERNHPEKTRV